MIPILGKVECEVGWIAGDSEVDGIWVGVDRAAAVAGTNITANVIESVFNMRTDLGGAIAGELTAFSAITENITDPTIDITLDREQRFRDVNGTPANALSTPFKLHYEPKHPPVLAASSAGLAMYLYWGGTVAVSGFATAEAVVCPKGWVAGLEVEPCGNP